jgi:hypothetical protein
MTTALDDYPLMALFPFTHDSVHTLYDCYYDGSYRSSDIGSNFAVQKFADTYRISYDSGLAQGFALTLNTGFELNTSGVFDVPVHITSGQITADQIDLNASTIALTGTTGNNIISITDNLADSFSVKEGATSYMTFTTTNGSELIECQKRLEVDISGTNAFSVGVGGVGADFYVDTSNRDVFSASDHTFQGSVLGTGATGGKQGNGTANFTAVYDDGILLTDYVFEQFLDGKVDESYWNSRVPDRINTVKIEKIRKIKKTVLNTAPDEFEDIKTDFGGDRILTRKKQKDRFIEIEVDEKYYDEIEEKEVTIHEPLRKFKERIGGIYDPLDIDKYSNHWKDKRHLSSLPDYNNGKVQPKISIGEFNQKLIETVEILAIHIDNLNQRIKLLEN